jgi:hypothetical protein
MDYADEHGRAIGSLISGAFIRVGLFQRRRYIAVGRGSAARGADCQQGYAPRSACDRISCRHPRLVLDIPRRKYWIQASPA